MFSMNLYDIGLLLYVDGVFSAGATQSNWEGMEFLEERGPQYGYYVQGAKLYYVCMCKDKVEARGEFARCNLTINFCHGRVCIEGFIGSRSAKEGWLEEKVATWVGTVETLAAIANKYLQAVYTGFTLCLQNQ